MLLGSDPIYAELPIRHTSSWMGAAVIGTSTMQVAHIGA